MADVYTHTRARSHKWQTTAYEKCTHTHARVRTHVYLHSRVHVHACLSVCWHLVPIALFVFKKEGDLPVIVRAPPSMPAKKASSITSTGSTRASSVLSKFGGKSAGRTSATDSQVEQKREASKRNNILNSSSCPQHVKDKWDEICKLGKGKNQAKGNFTAVLIKDQGQWTDAYWQASVSETHERKTTNTSEWMLKSKALTDHGGGQVGAAAIDEAVAAGIYEERVVFQGKDTFGKPIKLAQIRVKTEKSDQSHTTGLTEKTRVGAVADQDVFKRHLANLHGGGSVQDKQKHLKAITDKPQLPAIEDKPGTLCAKAKAKAVISKIKVLSKKPAGVMSKKPAGCSPAMSVAKKPAACGPSSPAMTEQLKAQHDQEQQAQNDQVNKCLEAALKQLATTEMKARRLQAQAQAAGPGSKIQEVHEPMLASSVTEMSVMQDKLKDVMVQNLDLSFQDKKVDLLEQADKMLQEAKDIMNVLQKSIAPRASAASASSRK